MIQQYPIGPSESLPSFCCVFTWITRGFRDRNRVVLISSVVQLAEERWGCDCNVWCQKRCQFQLCSSISSTNLELELMAEADLRPMQVKGNKETHGGHLGILSSVAINNVLTMRHWRYCIVRTMHHWVSIQKTSINNSSNFTLNLLKIKEV